MRLSCSAKLPGARLQLAAARVPVPFASVLALFPSTTTELPFT